MPATPHNLKIVHNNDYIYIPNVRQPVSDDGAVLHDLVHGVLKSVLCAGVYIAGGVVWDQDSRINYKGSGGFWRYKKLPQALADAVACVSENSVVTLLGRA